MLTEFFLTPDAISDPDGRDGADVIRELKTCLFPFSGTPAALVCKLGGDEWVRAVSSKIARISDGAHRRLAQTLLMQIVDQIAVSRPSASKSPADEAAWVQAGLLSSKSVPLNGVVSTSFAKETEKRCVALKDFSSPAFWETISNPRLVGRELASQKKVLQALCTHAGWLMIRMPQIRGGSDDEIVTVKQIAKLATGLPAGFIQSDIDLHICLIRNIPQARLITGVEGQLRPLVRRGVRINLTVWPEKHFVNREIVGGDYATTSTGVKQRKALWWLTMTHVAVGGTYAANAGEAGNTWSLFPRDKSHGRLTTIEKDVPVHSAAVPG